LRPYATFSNTVIGNGVGFWKIIPTRLRSSMTSTLGSSTSTPSISTAPVARWSRYSSKIRLYTRMCVDLPHPDGPMMAVTFPSAIARSFSWSACWFP